MRVLATPLEEDSRRLHFLIEAKSVLSSLGKMIGEQYKIKVIAQAETIRHKRDLWTFIERSLRIKKDCLSEDRINVSGPGQVRGEMYITILDRVLSRQCFAVDEGERELGGVVFGITEAFFAFSLVYEKSMVSTPGH